MAGGQKYKLSEMFASGGSKEGTPEQLFYAEQDRLDPEWKVMELLRNQMDSITDTINENDTGSGSFASELKVLTTASESFSARTTINDAKVGFNPTMPTATAGTTVSISVTKSIKGLYALVFTMVDSTNKKGTVTKTATIGLI